MIILNRLNELMLQTQALSMAVQELKQEKGIKEEGYLLHAGLNLIYAHGCLHSAMKALKKDFKVYKDELYTFHRSYIVSGADIKNEEVISHYGKNLDQAQKDFLKATWEHAAEKALQDILMDNKEMFQLIDTRKEYYMEVSQRDRGMVLMSAANELERSFDDFSDRYTLHKSYAQSFRLNLTNAQTMLRIWLMAVKNSVLTK